MVVAGGLRSRFIRDSLQNMLRDSLEARGWFESNRRHKPLLFVIESLDWDQPIELNSLAVSAADMNGTSAEMGSNLTDDQLDFYVDFYAESETLGLDVIHDVRDILRGKLSSIGRWRPILEVYDYSLATTVVIFNCDIEDVVVDRATGFNRPWMKHMWNIRFTVVDTWLDDSVPEPEPVQPGSDGVFDGGTP